MKLVNFLAINAIAFLLLSSCCKDCKTQLKECNAELANCKAEKCLEVPPKEDGTQFVLTLKLDKRNTDNSKRHQTIFVESPKDSSGNAFAIAAKFFYEDYVNGNYHNVTIKNMVLRRLTGDSYKIVEVRTRMGENSYTKNESGLIDIKIKKIPNNGRYRDEFEFKGHIEPFKKLSANQTIQTDVTFEEKAFWRPRICESLLSSGPDN